MINSIHHLNCGSMCPYCQKLVNGTGSWLDSGNIPCHCLLLDTSHGLILIDTGFGTKDVQSPNKRLGRLFTSFAKPKLTMKETAIDQIEKLGYISKDVTHIIPTHLDVDHIGGLDDFPFAKIHIYRPEIQQLIAPSSFIEKMRFRNPPFKNRPQWIIHEATNSTWFNHAVIQPIPEISNICLLPLIGHTKGHVGVAVKTENKWLLHCGDAYFHRGQITDEPIPYGLKIFERMAAANKKERTKSLELLRKLYKNYDKEIEIFCAHDPKEFEYYLNK